MLGELKTFFSKFSKAIIVLDEEGKVLVENFLATKFNSRSKSLNIIGNRIVCFDKELEIKLKEMVDAALYEKQCSTFFWEDKEFEYPLRIEVCSTNYDNMPSAQKQPYLIVSLDTPGLKTQKIHHQLQTYYGFTRTEFDLVEHLVRGLTLREYAKERKVTISTARWTLGNIFTKANLNSQRELIMLATHFSD